ncbi:MAG: hypothetical protein HY223_03245 [Thaumarchaeota archaeon]|nr:hypothetical protein [Nitrososphaerota archaeon]
MAQTIEIVSSKEKFFDKLKENYVQRIQECENFSKRFSTACLDVNTEFLYGMLDLIQQNIDLQKKYAKYFPSWWNYNMAIKQSNMLTEAWIQSIQHLDSFYIEFLKYMKTNLRTNNKTLVQITQDAERYLDIYKKTELVQDKPDLEDKDNSKQIVSRKEPNLS